MYILCFFFWVFITNPMPFRNPDIVARRQSISSSVWFGFRSGVIAQAIWHFIKLAQPPPLLWPTPLTTAPCSTEIDLLKVYWWLGCLLLLFLLLLLLFWFCLLRRTLFVCLRICLACLQRLISSGSTAFTHPEDNSPSAHIVKPPGRHHNHCFAMPDTSMNIHKYIYIHTYICNRANKQMKRVCLVRDFLVIHWNRK